MYHQHSLQQPGLLNTITLNITTKEHCVKVEQKNNKNIK